MFWDSTSKRVVFGTFLVAQWLRLRASKAGDAGLIPGQGTKIPHATWPKKKRLSFIKVQGYLTEWEEFNATCSGNKLDAESIIFDLFLNLFFIIQSAANYHGLGANGPVIQIYSRQ